MPPHKPSKYQMHEYLAYRSLVAKWLVANAKPHPPYATAYAAVVADYKLCDRNLEGGVSAEETGKKYLTPQGGL